MSFGYLSGFPTDMHQEQVGSRTRLCDTGTKVWSTQLRRLSEEVLREGWGGRSATSIPVFDLPSIIAHQGDCWYCCHAGYYHHCNQYQYGHPCHIFGSNFHFLILQEVPKTNPPTGWPPPTDQDPIIWCSQSGTYLRRNLLTILHISEISIRHLHSDEIYIYVRMHSIYILMEFEVQGSL